jgi:hypothetical protein
MKKSKIAAALLIAMSTVAMSAAKADVINDVTYYFSNSGLYSGVKVADPNIFATATFHYVNSTTIELTMSALSGLDAGDYVSDWGFNLANAVTYTGASYVDGVAVTNNGISYDTNNGNPFGGKKYTLEFSFPSSNPGQLQYPSYSVYDITGTNLLPTSFVSAAVHVQGTINPSSFYAGTTTDGSGPGNGVDVPEPGTVAVLGLGMLGLAFARRRKSK